MEVTEKKKVCFDGICRNFDPEKSVLVRLIREVCDIELTDMKHADYLVYSVFSNKHWFAPEKCIKIFWTGEMISPDFSACDYAIGFDFLSYGDRYIRMPLYYFYDDINEIMESKHLSCIDDVVSRKTGFCSITISNENRDPIFKDIYTELSNYKKVDSGGKWNNNIGKRVGNKLSFDMTRKFSIVCENCSFPGYTTEKLIQAFAANCIPIYWGDPSITKVFNPKSFINVMDFDSIKDVVDAVREIDLNDGLYYKMLKEPVYIDESYQRERQFVLFRDFLSHIFNATIPDDVMKRNRTFWGARYVKEQRRRSIIDVPIGCLVHSKISKSVSSLIKKFNRNEI